MRKKKANRIRASIRETESGLPAPAPPVSLRMGDPASAPRLLSGFYPAEEGAFQWRWTGPAFSVMLPVPMGAAQRGVLVRLFFWVSDQMISAHPNITVSAKIESATLASKTFSHAGDQKLEVDVPPAALAHESAVLDFTVEQPFSPGGGDVRLLGVVAVSVDVAVR